MGRINYGRVALGGVVAGLVFLLFDWLSMFVLGMDMEAWAREHNLQQPSPAVFVLIDILLGILLVWLYAAIRPRFGVGPRTALIAGAFFWVFFSLVYGGFTALGLWTGGEYLRFAGWGVLTVAAATMAGAWLYREEGATTM